jgi:hypothetical protein
MVIEIIGFTDSVSKSVRRYHLKHVLGARISNLEIIGCVTKTKIARARRHLGIAPATDWLDATPYSRLAAEPARAAENPITSQARGAPQICG